MYTTRKVNDNRLNSDDEPGTKCSVYNTLSNTICQGKYEFFM